MHDLDAALARLTYAPTPLALETLEARVLARIAAQPTVRSGPGLGALAVVTALTMGVAGAGVPAAPAFAVSPLAPLGPSSPLAPSTLLAGVP
jgi:hypothetical protein